MKQMTPDHVSKEPELPQVQIRIKFRGESYLSDYLDRNDPIVEDLIAMLNKKIPEFIFKMPRAFGTEVIYFPPEVLKVSIITFRLKEQKDGKLPDFSLR